MNRRIGPGTGAAIVLLLAVAIGAAQACDVASVITPQPAFGPIASQTPDNGGNVLPPDSGSGVDGSGNPAGSSGNTVQSNPGEGLPQLGSKPQPQDATYQGCPGQGDGGDPQLNIRKNRTDSAPWYPVSIASILQLSWPKSIERQQRANWSAADRATVAQEEGIPVQLEGWLAGAKQEGPEACNCHSPDDVDNHLWIVAAPNQDRTQSLVVEITPRVRAQHPGWAFDRIRPLVDGQTKVRISGWLLLDQEHPEQLGKTRGTIWEIHPIIAFDVQRGNGWVTLDTGRAAPANVAGAVPTEDPNLPPAIVETPPPSARIRPPARPTAPASGGQGQGNGPIVIDDIFAKGTIKPNEPDEYVAISNVSARAVNMDGWVLHDIYGGQQFTWQGFTLGGGQSIRVYTNEIHPETGGFSFGSKAAIWANKGDAAELLDANGTVVSTFSYGSR